MDTKSSCIHMGKKYEGAIVSKGGVDVTNFGEVGGMPCEGSSTGALFTRMRKYKT